MSANTNPAQIANAWITEKATRRQKLFGYTDGYLTIQFQHNERADSETIRKACIEAVNKYFSQTF